VRHLLLATLAVTLLAAAPAAAAPPWSAPENVSSPSLFVDSATLGFAKDGTGLATWAAGNRNGTTVSDAFAGASLAHGAAAFGGEGPLFRAPQPEILTPPVFYATSRTLAATSSPVSSDPKDQRVRLDALFGRASSGLGVARTIAVQKNLRDPQVAVDAAGHAALAWFEDRGVNHDRVYVSLRFGGSFSAPILLAEGQVRSVSVAVSPRGDVLVAWDANGVIRTRIKFAVNKRFSAIDTITSHKTYSAQLHAAMTDRGRAFVAWSSQLRTEGGSTGPVYYQAAVRPAGAARFRGATLLEENAPTQRAGSIDLAVDPATQRPVVAWSGFDGAHYIVRASTTNAGLHFQTAQNVSAPGVDTAQAVLATSPDGRRLVTWIDVLSDAPDGILRAAVAPAGAPFGAPETVSDGPAARIPSAAFDAVDNRWAIVWSNRPAGNGGPIADIKTYLQSAFRAG
jgi:hypothetical protein